LHSLDYSFASYLTAFLPFTWSSPTKNCRQNPVKLTGSFERGAEVHSQPYRRGSLKEEWCGLARDFLI